MTVLELDRLKPIDLSPALPIDQNEKLVILESEVQLASTDSVDTVMEVVKNQPRSLNLKKYLTAGALGMSVASAALLHPAIAGIVAINGMVGLACPRLKKSKKGKIASYALAVASVSLTAPLAMNVFATPANALIFNNAQTAFTTAFPLAGTVIPIIFNIFRAVYITYLLYSAISIWTSYQRDEDWMSAAKAPIIVFVAAELTDAVAQMIFA